MTATAPRSTFRLDPQLAADTIDIEDLALSRVLLMNDARYPWLILVPRRDGASEIIDLPPIDRASLMEEITACCQVLRDAVRPDKLNIGALGNRVAQLHVHVIGRFHHDAAWPDPVWGRGPPVRYDEVASARFAATIGAALLDHGFAATRIA